MARRYFEDEMRFLHEAGKVFAETHPEQGRYLNIDSVTDRDPYVERLFEGFAFLAGRIHERLDDDLPEYTDGLFSLLYPHFLKPIPSCAIVAFKPRAGLIQETTVLPRGTEVRSGPVGPERAVCRFRTTQAVHLQPLQLRRVALEWAPDGTTSARLSFQLEATADFSALRLDPLRLHCHGDPSIASLMHLFFTRHVRRVEVTADFPDPNDPALTHAKLSLEGQQWVRPGGFTDDEGLVPYSPYSFTGFRLLQEYLSFRPKFWFVDLLGLSRFVPSQAFETFHVRVVFDREYPQEKRFGADNLRLYCAPVVNLFEQDAEPIRVAHQASEYRVTGSVRYPKSVEVYDVKRVVGIEERTGVLHQYEPFYSYHHGAHNGHRFYTTSVRLAPNDRYATYLAFDSGEPADDQLRVETMSLEVRCTNGSLPREKLQERMLTQLAPEVPSVAEPTNLNQPTLIRYPPLDQTKDLFWKLISHFSFNYLSVASKDALTGLLELYDWTDSVANRRRIAGIRDVTWTRKEVLFRGAIQRGVDVRIDLQEGHFADEGDVCLFGQVMSTFFSMYATLNSFVHLTLRLMPSEKTFTWQPTTGDRPLL